MAAEPARRAACELLETRQLFNGSPDPTFSADGLLTHSIRRSNDPTDIAVQADGRQVVAVAVASPGGNKDVAVARYDVDGTLDATFGGGNSFVNVPIGSSDDLPTGVAIDSQGRIVVSGFSTSNNGEIFVARLLSNGTLDNTSGGTGVVVLPNLGGADTAAGLVENPDDSVVVSGTRIAGPSSSVLLAKFSSAGVLDPTFGTGGVSVSNGGGTTGDIGGRMVRDANGNYYVAGARPAFSLTLSFLHSAFMLCRFTPNGGVDTTFSSDGRTFASFGNRSKLPIQLATSVALDPRNGLVLVAGATANGLMSFGTSNLPVSLLGVVTAATIANFALARFTTGGRLDGRFGDQGRVVGDFGVNRLDGASDVVVDANGNSYVGGGSQIRRSASDTAIFAVSPAGRRLATFAGGYIL